MKELNFVFEDEENSLNLIQCKDLNGSGIARFTPSPVATTEIRRFRTKYKNIVDFVINANEKDKVPFIIASGVAHSPWDWCGYTDLDKRYDTNMRKTESVMFYLSDYYLESLRNKTAFLLLDQTHEGYHVEWLYEWFHDMCNHYSVSPNQIIYTTGDLDSDDKYQKWCEENNIKEKIHILPFPHFEYVIHTTMVNRVRIHNLDPIPTYQDQIEYKKANLHSIKKYNCLQKRPRAHRAWLYYSLYKQDLLDNALLSMNTFSQRNTWYCDKEIPKEDYNKLVDKLPIFPTGINSTTEQNAFESASGSGFITDLNHDIMLNSWISVISEASFAENTCFVSEKSFKPIASCHPFIIYGNKGSLRRLHDMGYKTFDRWWDESYDMLDAWERLDAVVDIIKQINSMTQDELLRMYNSMKDVLEHNLQQFHQNSKAINPMVEQIIGITDVL